MTRELNEAFRQLRARGRAALRRDIAELRRKSQRAGDRRLVDICTAALSGNGRSETLCSWILVADLQPPRSLEMTPGNADRPHDSGDAVPAVDTAAAGGAPCQALAGLAPRGKFL